MNAFANGRSTEWTARWAASGARSPGSPPRLLALAALGLFTACSGDPDAAAPRTRSLEFPVQVLTLAPESVEYIVDAVGSVEAFEEIQIAARVAGTVERINFQEGDAVDESQILAEVDPARHRLAEASARAALQRAVANRSEAELSYARREGLNAENPGLVREEELMAHRSKLESARADEAQAKAALDLAAINHRDAYVRAPAAGIVQSRRLQTGQYVQPGAVLATLVRTDPLLLRFQIPEHEAHRVKTASEVSFLVRGSDTVHTAQIKLVAATARSATRMVDVTAHVNEPVGLHPGAFARVRVPVGGDGAAIVIPQMAIRPSQRGFLAFTVENGKAVEHVLRLGMRTEQGRVEVLEGLRAGVQLVVRGGEALSAGASVRVIEEAPRETQPVEVKRP